MYFVYVLRSLKTGKLYKGLTNNLERRLKQHQLDHVASTKNILPLQLVHVDLCNTRTDARSVEKMLKSGYGREVLKEIIDS